MLVAVVVDYRQRVRVVDLADQVVVGMVAET
jgi:hypothetical protein